MTPKSNLSYRLLEKTLLGFLFVIANRRAWYCFFVLDPKYRCDYGFASTDFVVWGCLVIGFLLLVIRRRLLVKFFHAWRTNWILVVFLIYSFISIVWASDPMLSLQTAFIFTAASLSASYLAFTYKTEQLITILLWFFGITALLSLASVIILPQVSIMSFEGLMGSWRGILDHKNYLGSLMALGNSLFLMSVWQPAISLRRKLICIAFYGLTLFLVVMSKSATGLMLVVILYSLIVIYFSWMTWRNRIRPRHFAVILTVLVFCFGFLIMKLDTFFALFGKSSSLTGRVPLWSYLFRYVISRRPWFGYGSETYWATGEFRRLVGGAAWWDPWMVNAHNGYVDILIYLGMIGLLVFAFLLLQIIVYAVQYAFRSPSWRVFFPLLILTDVLVANLTISYFVEFESFHWILLVLVLFITTADRNSHFFEKLPRA